MYISEDLYKDHINTLKNEGFPFVYCWEDLPGFVYEKHCHQDKVSFFVEKGGVSFVFEDGDKLDVSQGQRFDVPIKKYHTAIVMDSGCVYTVGQMSENDA